MNKFKKIMLGALSVLTLGLFVATGAKVDAKEVTDTYTYTVTDFSGVSNATGSNTKTVTATSDTSTNTLGLKLTNNSTAATSTNSGRLRIAQPAATDESSITFTFTNTHGSITLDLGLRTQGKKHTWDLTFDSQGTITTDADTYDHTFSSSTVGDHTLTIERVDATKALDIRSLVIKETYDNGVAGYDYDAAITAGNYRTVTFAAGSNGSISSTPTTLKYFYEDGAASDRYNGAEWPTATPSNKYTFVGWFNGTTKYDESSTISDNITLTAKFEAITITDGTFTFGATDAYTTYLKTVGIVSYKKDSDAARTVTWTDGESMSSGEGETIAKSTSFITLKLYEPAMIKFYGVSNNNSSTTTVSFVKDSTDIYEVTLSTRQSTNATVAETYLEAGTYNFSTSGQNVIAYKLVIDYVTINSNSEVGEQDTTVSGDLQVRLIGTLPNITDPTKLEAVSFVLTKDGKNAKKIAKITTVYTSVKNTKEATDNTYYAVFKLTGMNSITGSFTANLVYTYDGVTYISPVKEFSLS